MSKERAPMWLCAGALALAAASCGQPQIVVSSPLAVVNFAPHDGATGIDPSASQGVCFNHEVDPTAAAGKVALAEDPGAEVTGLEVKSAAAGVARDSLCLEIAHAPLRTDAPYRIRIARGLEAKSGDTLAADVTSSFRTARP